MSSAADAAGGTPIPAPSTGARESKAVCMAAGGRRPPRAAACPARASKAVCTAAFATPPRTTEDAGRTSPPRAAAARLAAPRPSPPHARQRSRAGSPRVGAGSGAASPASASLSFLCVPSLALPTSAGRPMSPAPCRRQRSGRRMRSWRTTQRPRAPSRARGERVKRRTQAAAGSPRASPAHHQSRTRGRA
ncbi:hypothetical protein FB451DRAFT_1272927 [Mycena latifolia]|nr:hypothetical protein FB451DRAFT_1272927 [Mycena latifolia]